MQEHSGERLCNIIGEKMIDTNATKTGTEVISKTIQVEVPVREAYNQWTQFESFPQFMSGVDKITQIDDTRTHWEVSIGGVKKEFDAEIVEQHPDDKIAWQSMDGVNHSGIVTFKLIDLDTTEISVQMMWEPEGFVEKAGATLNFDEAQVEKDLKKFKELIESRSFTPTGWRGTVN